MQLLCRMADACSEEGSGAIRGRYQEWLTLPFNIQITRRVVPPRRRCSEADGQLSNLKLCFLDLFRRLNTADRNCRHVESLESEHRSNPLLHTAMCSTTLFRYLQDRTRTRRHMRPVDFNSRIARCEAAYPSRVITAACHGVGWPG